MSGDPLNTVGMRRGAVRRLALNLGIVATPIILIASIVVPAVNRTRNAARRAQDL